MPQAHGIIAKFGGTWPMATALGVPPSTVQGWKRGGYIPARRQAHVLLAARRLGIDIGPDDFFDLGRDDKALGRAPGR